MLPNYKANMRCKNCANELTTYDTFCSKCGGRVIKKRITFKNLLSQFVEEFLNYDNRIFKTFIHLFTKPEEVINGYLKGVRKRYANPVSYFAIALTVTGLWMFISTKYFPGVFDFSAVTVEGQEEQINKQMKGIMEYQSLLFMLNVPIYALLSYFVFFTLRKYNYAEHLVFFLFTVAQITFAFFIPQIILMAVGLNIGQMSLITLPLQILYTAYCFKRVFDLSIGGLILRTMFFVLLLIISLILIGIVQVVYGVLKYGGFEEFLKAQEALQKGGNP